MVNPTRVPEVFTEALELLNLTDINNGVKPVITVSLEWVNDDTINDLDKDIGEDSSYLLVDFNATQYKG